MLLERGLPNARELEGGFAAWQKAGYSVVPIPTLSKAPVVQLGLGLNVGDVAIEFWLKDLNGTQVSLAELVARKPVMLEFGSYTCSQFREQVAATERLMAKYRDQVQFVLVYVIEPQPFGSKSPYSDGEWQSLYSYDIKGNPVPATKEQLAMSYTQVTPELIEWVNSVMVVRTPR